MKRDILKLIEDGERGFSKGQRHIASYIKEHYDKAAFMTAARLGAKVKDVYRDLGIYAIVRADYESKNNNVQE